MNEENSSSSAFPFGQVSEQTGLPVNGFFSPGLTKLELFAFGAMQGLLAKNGTCHPTDAYDMAEAMLRRGDDDKWISTEERMPKIETPVLAKLKGNPVPVVLERVTETPGFEDTHEAFDFWEDPNDKGVDIPDEDVTHWTRLIIPLAG